MMMFKKICFSMALLVSLSVSVNTYAEEKLVFAVDVIRHGDRNPTVDIPVSPYLWPEGLGELTPLGMQQEYQLGQRLRQKYVDQYHLLPAKYRADTLYVRSTNVNRTLMSAESLLYGLYPLGVGAATLPSAYQPIPIHTIKKEDETLLIPDQNRYRFGFLLLRHVFFTPEWRQKTEELKSHFAYWSALTGVPINHLYDFIAVADNLQIRQKHHVPLPAGMSEAVANQIIAEGEWVFVHLFQSPGVSTVSSHALLSMIKDYFEAAQAGRSPLKYVLFSAHDSTILSAMSAMRAPYNHQPPYASDLNFALFKTGKNQYSVRITLNNQPVSLPGCRGDACTLEQFKKVVG